MNVAGDVSWNRAFAPAPFVERLGKEFEFSARSRKTALDFTVNIHAHETTAFSIAIRTGNRNHIRRCRLCCAREDAMEMMKEAIFSGDELPEVEYITENVDVSTLDAGHVLPNMGNPVVRGIWFPSGFVVAP